MGERELGGRVAIVTGAGRNIGREIALALARGGAKVVVNARSNRIEAQKVSDEIERLGGEALPYLADVGDAGAVAQMATAAAHRFGRIDVLVNNAALRKETTLDDISIDEWRTVLATVLDGAFNCIKACLPHLRGSGAGAIINIGGLSGHTGARHRAHVVTAKAGLVGLTRALAHDLAADNMTVNCVSPGLIDTARDPMAALPHHHAVNRTLVGRLGTPAEIAAAVRFLAGPSARYITGQTIHVNGGAYLT
jgi:3-oxoacyl-[acyl-carrier protein] reductase